MCYNVELIMSSDNDVITEVLHDLLPLTPSSAVWYSLIPAENCCCF